MVLLLAVAVMAVAVASWIIATTFRIRIRENMTDAAQTRRLVTQVADRLKQAEKRLRTQSDHDQTRWADEFETVRQQIGEAHVLLARHDAQIRQHENLLGDQETVTGRPRPVQQAHEELERLQRAVRDLDRRARQAEEAAVRSAGLSEEASAGLADLRRQADLRLAGVARDVSRLSRHLNGIREYVRAQLDHDVAATRGQPGHRVLVGGIHTEEPTAADVLPLLYDSFLQQLPLETLFQDAGRYYLLWRSANGEKLEQRLERLLQACAAGSLGPGSGPGLGPGPGDEDRDDEREGEQDAQARGLAELRGLMLALHGAGQGTLQAGPLVVFRTSDRFAGVVLTAEEADLLDGQSTLPGPEECRALLKGLGEGRLTDLDASPGGQPA
jgi:transcriptional regulator NrdR family protein